MRKTSPHTSIVIRAPALARSMTAGPAELPDPATMTSSPPQCAASLRPAR